MEEKINTSDPLSDLIEDVEKDELLENEEEMRSEFNEDESLKEDSEELNEKKATKESDDEESDDEESEDEESEGEESEDDDEDSKEKLKKENTEETVLPESIVDLLNAEDSLTEEFINQTAEIFNSELSEELEKRSEELETKYNKILEEKLEESVNDLVEKIDNYLNYVVETWVKENEVAIESGLRTEIAENFIESLKTVFQENYIEVPEEREDLIAGLEENVNKLEEKLANQIKHGISLQEEITQLKREKILNEASKDLALTESEKLVSLTEDLDFDDEKSFKDKVTTIKESYFNKEETSDNDTDDSLLNEDKEEEMNSDPYMKSIVSSLSKQIKRK